MNAALREFRVALMLLSRLPAGRIEGAAPNLADARWAFPLVGLALGLIGWAVHAGALASGAPAPVAAVLALAALALATGALHFDGLADFADGIGGGRDRAHALEIMRDSRVGSYGVLALILIVALWLAALASLGAAAGLAPFLVIGALSRVAMIGLQETQPAARSDGLGRMAAGRSGRARLSAAAAVLLAGLAVGWQGVALAATCAVVAAGTGVLARRKLGGITGDVLGATQLLAEAFCWAVLATFWPG